MTHPLQNSPDGCARMYKGVGTRGVPLRIPTMGRDFHFHRAAAHQSGRYHGGEAPPAPAKGTVSPASVACVCLLLPDLLLGTVLKLIG
jgi:hypothetical protein